MPAIHVSEREIWDEMAPLVSAMPYKDARNIALVAVFKKKGIRLGRHSLFGFYEPEIDPPFEISFDPSRMEFVIDQQS